MAPASGPGAQVPCSAKAIEVVQHNDAYRALLLLRKFSGSESTRPSCLQLLSDQRKSRVYRWDYHDF
jgi:hypothetical protein